MKGAGFQPAPTHQQGDNVPKSKEQEAADAVPESKRKADAEDARAEEERVRAQVESGDKQSSKEKKAEKDAQVEASKVDKPLSPAEANPIIGAHLESVEGAVDLSRYPDVAESVQEKLEERFEAGEDVKQ